MTVSRILAIFAVLVVPGETMAAALLTLLPNTISVEPGVDGPAQAEPVFSETLDGALAARGFTTLQQPGHARLIAALAVSRTEVGTTPSSVPVAGPSAMAGGATGVGASFSVNLPTAKQRMVPLVRTRIDLQLIARADGKVLWQGSAVTVRAADADPHVVASALTDGVLGAEGGSTDGVVAVR